MKEELYLWIRNLAVFYIFFTAVLNLIPDQKYDFRIFRKSIWKKVTNWNWNRKSGKLWKKEA